MKKFKFNKIFNKVSLMILVLSFVFGSFGINNVLAATSPTLGAADSFSVIAQTGITGIATIIGNVENNSIASQITDLITTMVTGIIYSSDGGNTLGTPPASTTILPNGDVQANLSTAYDNLDSAVYDNSAASCIKASTSGSTPGTDTGVIELGGKSLAPGVYCTDGSFEITGHLTLLGTIGTWVFKSATGLTTMTDSSVTGGDPCNVWWRIGTAAAGLGDNSTFIGTIIASTGITFGTGVTLDGRALALGAAVTLASGGHISGPTCSAPAATLTLVKAAGMGGPLTPGDFTLHAGGVSLTSVDGLSGTAAVTDQPVAVGTYTLSETAQPNYTAVGPWICNSGKTVTDNTVSLLNGDDVICTLENTYTAPVVHHSRVIGSIPRVVVPVFQPSITILSTPVVVAPIIPKLPKTGFAPQESGVWYESLLNNILDLFR